MVPLSPSRTPLSESAATALSSCRVCIIVFECLDAESHIHFADFSLIDSLAHFARERVPERVVRLHLTLCQLDSSQRGPM